MPTRIFDFTDAEILGLRVTPERSELFYPDTLQLQAFGWFEDGYERPVRRDVTWTSLDADLVSVATAGSEIGKVTPQGAEGLATVRATARNTEGELKADADIRVYRP
ncbi:Ig-like domain-containing protein [Fontimonas thermophila]|uniref:Ig-like domain-containing protein n=1 Tax=Fontimonas thermophila TaxID=1076937 RepID=UPI001F2FDE81|nr:Ig-like domain-containing protein [Fontimonas thermophila]